MQPQVWHSKTPLLKEDWEIVLASTPYAVVLFGAAWSPPHLLQNRVIQRITSDFSGKIAFFVADLDDENGVTMATHFEVMTNPMLVYLREEE